jgi:hypothetical protein
MVKKITNPSIYMWWMPGHRPTRRNNHTTSIISTSAQYGVSCVLYWIVNLLTAIIVHFKLESCSFLYLVRTVVGYWLLTVSEKSHLFRVSVRASERSCFVRGLGSILDQPFRMHGKVLTSSIDL